ncbi:hypothetical protein BDQ17DRAFT_1418879 [Cyathus striatus]|nr:hypothetical protein BDQ17DRAFT_1418879 [Cyathus striatus]
MSVNSHLHPSSSSAISSSQRSSQTFEFTKRKRWADLLINELVDVIIFILNPSGKVLYCGTAVTDLLGWRDIDLIECEFLDYVNPEDHASFRTSFNDSMRTKTEMLSYVRLKCHTPPTTYGAPATISRDLLFEVKGYPHFLEEEPGSPRCFFIMAKPYPSKNTALLNTFLELKVENERLQQRALELRNRLPLQLAASAIQSSGTTQQNSMYATSSMQSSRGHSGALSTQRMDNSGNYYTTPALSSGSYEDSLGSASMNTFEGSMYGNNNFYGANPEEESEDGSKKKKLKKSHTAEQYVCVTCGRTDSPEWRKGPQGPKTLCNACGLRWAKQMRKTDEISEGSNGGLDSGSVGQN